MTEWELSEAKQAELDKRLIDIKPAEEDGWSSITFRAPKNFINLMEQTIIGYKFLRETQKTFPALEAIFMEAFNSLPQEIIRALPQDQV